MGYNQEAHDAERAALVRALEVVSRRKTVPERVTIFSDAQAAIRRMASDGPGPEQQYALQARKHIAALRRARPGIVIEIRWCPAHKGIAGNEKADEWAKMAAAEPNSPRGGRAEPLQSNGRAVDVPPKIPRQPQRPGGGRIGGRSETFWRMRGGTIVPKLKWKFEGPATTAVQTALSTVNHPSMPKGWEIKRETKNRADGW